MTKTLTHYENLKVTRDAPDEVIRASFNALMQLYHPEKFVDREDEALMAAIAIKESYDVLINSNTRYEYDRWIDEQFALPLQAPLRKNVVSQKPEVCKAEAQPQVITLKNRTDWARHAAGKVLLIGALGVGKAYIAAAIAGHSLEQNVRVKWFSAIALIKTLQQAKWESDLMTAMRRLNKYQVLIIDDISNFKHTDAESAVLFEFITAHYESGSLIATSNQPFRQWANILPDTMMSVAAADRNIFHADIIEIEVESCQKQSA